MKQHYTLPSKHLKFFQRLANEHPARCPDKLNEVIKQYLEQGTHHKNLLHAVAFSHNATLELESIKRKLRKLQENYHRLQNVIDCLNQQTILRFKQIDKRHLQGSQFSVSLRRAQSKVVIESTRHIPTQFFKSRTTSAVNKAMLKAALQGGQFIQGATLQDVLTLKITH